MIKLDIQNDLWAIVFAMVAFAAILTAFSEDIGAQP
jgi:hypothetical protein